MKLNIVEHNKGARPNIKLTIQRVEATAWEMFKKHHYLTEEINKSCKCFIFKWDNQIVGFVGILNTPRKGRPNDVAISRLVVLPDFQGLGIGAMIARKIGGIFKANGYNLFIKTVNDSLGYYFERDTTNWRPTAFNGKVRKNVDFEKGNYNNRLVRKSYCYAFEGESLNGFEHIIRPIAEMRENKKKKLFDF